MIHKVYSKGFLALALLAPALFVFVQPAGLAAAASNPISVTLDGKALTFDVQPQIVKGRTLVPFSQIATSLGGTTTWNEANNTVVFKKDKTQVTYTVGSTTAKLNDETLVLDAAPINISGRTLVPLRFIAEAFGKWVKWDAAKNQIAITSTRTVQTKDGSVTLTKKPLRIATLAQADTEIIYALGGKVVGKPTASGPVIPEETKSITEIGTTHSINFEKLAAVNADLLIASTSNKKDIPTIEKLGAQVVLTSVNSYEDTQYSINLIGEILGKEDEAAKLIVSLDQKLAILQKNQLKIKPKALIIFGAPGTFLVALPSSFSGNLLELAGGVNIASAFEPAKGYPQYATLSLERIVAANPEVIYLLAHGDPVAVLADFKKELTGNPAWNNLKAVKNDKVIILPADLFVSNPGPRVVEAIDYLQNSLAGIN